MHRFHHCVVFRQRDNYRSCAASTFDNKCLLIVLYLIQIRLQFGSEFCIISRNYNKLLFNYLSVTRAVL